MKSWYEIKNINELDSPALVVYPDRVKENIRILKQFVPDVSRLRPHVKTNKCAQVCKLMMDEGIYKFKCATIAEAEMLGNLNAKDVLLAYQPVGPKVNRLVEAVKKFPATKFSCLIDSFDAAQAISNAAQTQSIRLTVFIDVNVGMNRTGIAPEQVPSLYNQCESLPGIEITGLHAYDGHLRDTDLNLRKEKCDAGFAGVAAIHSQLENQYNKKLVIVAGGTLSFPIHAQRQPVECSPGTFIFWDKGYQQILQEQPFLFAALVVTRIISNPAPGIFTTDLGHKAIASENPLASRVYFLNAEGLEPIGHSEEHLVLKTSVSSLKVGDVLYGVPHHICPTVALHETLAVVENHTVTGSWDIIARKRKISI
ncbi:MAG: D-TA family PLP-dependent enzyme [Cyclobacteriaceae bacterium]|nr:D-TA family PLP-dependent enzyme [Cyclobacteriaceae bacterium]